MIRFQIIKPDYSHILKTPHMYALLKNLPAKQIIKEHMPALVVSFIIADIFYKFGSFILECCAFLFTWYIISFLFDKLPVSKSS